MKLSIEERLQFGLIIPDKGDFITMTLRSDILKKVSLTQEEIFKIGLKFENDRYSWEAEKSEEIDVDFTEAEKTLIVLFLKELDSGKSLNEVTFGFYKKFI